MGRGRLRRDARRGSSGPVRRTGVLAAALVAVAAPVAGRAGVTLTERPTQGGRAVATRTEVEFGFSAAAEPGRAM